MEKNYACKRCGTTLVLGENWTQGQAKARSYSCRSCVSEKGKAHYRMHADRALETQRLRLQNPEIKKADTEYKRTYYAENKENWKQYRTTQKAKEYSDPWYRAGRLTTWVRARAAKQGMQFDLTREWTEEKLSAGVCEVTGMTLDLSKAEDMRFNPWGPSIDRIDSNKGYTQDNCRMVVWAYNMAKAEWDDMVVLDLARALVARYERGN